MFVFQVPEKNTCLVVLVESNFKIKVQHMKHSPARIKIYPFNLHVFTCPHNKILIFHLARLTLAITILLRSTSFTKMSLIHPEVVNLW